MAEGSVEVQIVEGIGRIEFSHPKANSLPSKLLGKLTAELERLSKDSSVRVIGLQSSGEKAFCAGASFEELVSQKELEETTEYFMGFARVILAMRASKKFIVTRVQGKAVGGAVGIIAASDYVLAAKAASLRLSELSLGFGPFVISLPVLRKTGVSGFSELAIDTEWREAKWAKRQGLYASVHDDQRSLDEAYDALLKQLAGRVPLAMEKIKEVAWNDTEWWERELPIRARYAAELALSKESQAILKKLI
ncbi:MAG: enoyl-CoA hydratase/isomerase family protein [Bdellovibrionales bacterium]|nr:enoyl-CoA hydratase/isomerase family protein [Bdellovibrionales bacterium]